MSKHTHIEHSKPNHEWVNASESVRHAMRSAEREVSRLMSLELDYSFGGGRNCGQYPCPNGPGDCSWFASHICRILGVTLKTWLGSTYSLAEEGVEGRGKFLTLMIKNPPDPHEAHVILELSHGEGTRKRHAECGGSDNPTPGNGPAWVNMDSARLAEFPIHRHFRGF